MVPSLFLYFDRWVTPNFRVLLEQFLGCVLGHLYELAEKRPVVRVIVEVNLSGLQIVEPGDGVVVFGDLRELELGLIELSGINLENRLWVAILLQRCPECLSLIPVILIKTSLEQTPLMVHLGNLIIKVSLLRSLHQLNLLLSVLLLHFLFLNLFIPLHELFLGLNFLLLILLLDFVVFVGGIPHLSVLGPGVELLLGEVFHVLGDLVERLGGLFWLFYLNNALLVF